MKRVLDRMDRSWIEVISLHLEMLVMIFWLVLCNSIFQNIWDVILPIDFHIFQDC